MLESGKVYSVVYTLIADFGVGRRKIYDSSTSVLYLGRTKLSEATFKFSYRFLSLTDMEFFTVTTPHERFVFDALKKVE